MAKDPVADFNDLLRVLPQVGTLGILLALRKGPTRWSDLRPLVKQSNSLDDRLGELKRLGLIRKDDGKWILTPHGDDICHLLDQIYSAGKSKAEKKRDTLIEAFGRMALGPSWLRDD